MSVAKVDCGCNWNAELDAASWSGKPVTAGIDRRIRFIQGCGVMIPSWKWLLFFAMGGCFLFNKAQAADKAVLAAEQARVDVLRRISPSVVAIFGEDVASGGGSGVLISADGLALTNFHVTDGAGKFMQCGLPDGKLYDAVIVGIDPTGDVALIKLLGRDDFPTAIMGDSDALQPGDVALVLGNPFLLANDFTPTVTYGIVSGVHRYQYPAGNILEYTDCIQVDASINPGNSGGPLFNAAGELVGINGRGSFEKRGRVNSGAGYAISINQIKHFLHALKGGWIVDHATLGAVVATRDDGALVVSDILESSDAYRRGLRVDDELVSFAGRGMRSVNQFKNILGIYPSNWRLPLVFRRDGEKREIQVRLQPLHSRSELVAVSGGQQQIGPRGSKPPAPERTTPHPGEKLFTAKEGFANYYFNEQEQRRLLESTRKLGDFGTATGSWKITGEWAKAACRLTLAPAGAGLTTGPGGGEQAYFQDSATTAELVDEPPGTGGLLMALLQWRLLLTESGRPFSEVTYVGREPVDAAGRKTVDVLETLRGNARCHWYFAVDTGDLIGWDLIRPDADRCEIRIVSEQTIAGRRLPDTLSVTSGDTPTRSLRMQQYDFGNPAAATTAALDGATSDHATIDHLKPDHATIDDAALRGQNLATGLNAANHSISAVNARSVTSGSRP